MRYVFPDQYEGKADGKWIVWGIVLTVMVIWLPLVSYTMGKISFEDVSEVSQTDQNAAETDNIEEA
jgi:hypothetical protein